VYVLDVFVAQAEKSKVNVFKLPADIACVILTLPVTDESTEYPFSKRVPDDNILKLYPPSVVIKPAFNP